MTTPITQGNIQTAVNLWCSDRDSAINTYGHISTWNTSQVTDMSGLFENQTTFKDDISGWDVSSVTDMSYMFEGAVAFNQPLSSWKVSSVTDMSGMFYYASNFQQVL